jgi:hypothetical protein
VVSQAEWVQDNLSSAKEPEADHQINHGNPINLASLQFCQEQRELGCHVEGSRERRLPVPAQSAKGCKMRSGLAIGQGREVDGES